MTDTLTPAKGLTQQTIGGNNNTWGTVLNTTLGLIDSALGGTLTLPISGNTTLNSTQVQNTGYKFTGSLSGTATITWPSYFGIAAIRNSTTGGFSIGCGMAGATVTVLSGETVAIWSDGTDFVRLSATGGGVTVDVSATPLANTQTAVSVLDDSAAITIVEEGLADQTYQISAGDLFTRGRNRWDYSDNGGHPVVVDAAKSYDIHMALSGTTVWLDISTLSLNEPYFFFSLIPNLYLDPGRTGAFEGWGLTAQPLLLGVGECVTIRQFSTNLYTVSGPGSPPVNQPFGSLPRVDITTGPAYTPPANGFGFDYSNLTSASLTVDVSGINSNAIFTFTANTGPIVLDISSSNNFYGLPSTKHTFTIPISCVATVLRWTTGIYFVWSFTGPPSIYAQSTTFSDLGSPLYDGQTAFCSNGRKVGEGAGSGTGVPVYASGGSWYVYSSDTLVTI